MEVTFNQKNHISFVPVNPDTPPPPQNQAPDRLEPVHEQADPESWVDWILLHLEYFLDALAALFCGRKDKDPDDENPAIVPLPSIKNEEIKPVIQIPKQVKKNPPSNNPFIAAIQSGELVSVQKLIPENPLCIEGEGKNALFYAIEEDHLEILNALIAAGFDPKKTRASDRCTPLICAARLANMEMVKRLRQIPDLEIEKEDSSGKTAFDYAKENGHDEMVEEILGLSSFMARSPETALYRAAALGRESLVCYLLQDENLALNNQGKTGMTALMMAISYGYPEIALKILALPGCAIDIQDGNGETALMKAAAHGQLEVVKQLMEKGADLKLQDKSSKTALHWAVIGKDLEVVDQLLSIQTMDLDVKDKKGETPLMTAVAQADLRIASSLITRGADVDSLKNADKEFFSWPGMFQGKYGETALTKAQSTGQPDLIDILTAHQWYQK